jgi:hypothetical protein
MKGESMKTKYQASFKSGNGGRVTHDTFRYFDNIRSARKWLRKSHYVPYWGDAVNDESGETWVRDIVANNECGAGDCESPYAEISSLR